MDFLSYSAEECAASEELMAIAVSGIRSGAWSPQSQAPVYCGIHACVMEAVFAEMQEHPEASVSQLCSFLLFDFCRMADLRVSIARAYLSMRGLL